MTDQASTLSALIPHRQWGTFDHGSADRWIRLVMTGREFLPAVDGLIDCQVLNKICLNGDLKNFT